MLQSHSHLVSCDHSRLAQLVGRCLSWFGLERSGRASAALLPSAIMELTRRQFMGLTAAACASPLLARCEGVPPPADPSEFLLDPAIAYLNTGSVGACPRVVLETHRRTWEQLELDPTQQAFVTLLPAAEAVRTQAADFLGCEAEELAIVRNTTDGMNQIAEGLNLQPGDEVLTTDQEHPGGFICWSFYQRQRQVAVTRVPLPSDGAPDVILKRFAEAITPATRVISVSHITYTSGMILPIRQLADLAHAHDLLLVVDGAQAAGQIPVNLHALDCDAYTTSPHKWLLAPKGSGLLVIRRRAQPRIQPLLLQRGYRVYTAATGTRDLPAIMALGAAIDFIRERGIEKIHAHNRALRDALLASLPSGMKSLSPPASAATMVTLAVTGNRQPGELATALSEQHRIAVRPITAKGIRGIRVSLHLYNTIADVERLVAALPQANAP